MHQGTMFQENEQWSVSHANTLEPTFMSASSQEEIADIAKRPIIIESYEWEIGLEETTIIDPWTLFFTNKRVINRIANFKLLRSKLKLQFQINGNPFYYGRMLVSYVPLPLQDSVSAARTGITQDRIEESQRMHLYLDPTTSTGGDMTLPFLYPKNSVEITRSEYDRLGRLYISVLSPLQHANGSSAPVTITIWAMAEEMHVDQLTSLNPSGIVPQAGEDSDGPPSSKPSKDEYCDGPVSLPASAVAKAAGALANAPVIGPYARATQIGAGALAHVAKIFGYSKPRSIETTMGYVADFNVNQSTVDGGLLAPTLALTSKQEVTIDPRTFGMNNKEDEMHIPSRAQHEAYLTRFDWRESDPANKLLFNIRVTPTLYDVYTSVTPPEVHMTPMCWASTPFEFWRGSIEYRFQFVASSYHRGKVRIVYDPNFQDTDEFNVNRQITVDLDTTQETVIRANWSQAAPYLPIVHIDDNEIEFGPDPLQGGLRDNGVISVYVVNELKSPNEDPNDIECLVFVKACEDFQVNVPYLDTIERAQIIRSFGNEGPEWRDVSFPGTLWLDQTLDPGQTIQNDITIFRTDAAINGVPDFNGNKDFAIPMWNQSVVPANVELTLKMRYTNTTGTDVVMSISGPGTLATFVMLASSDQEEVEVVLNPTVDPGFEVITFNFDAPGWVNDDVMIFYIDTFTHRVPPTVDYQVYSPGSGLATGLSVVPDPVAKYEDGSAVPAWIWNTPTESLFLNPPPGYQFAANTLHTFLKPEGQVDLSTSWGTTITASPTGTGFSLVKNTAPTPTAQVSTIEITSPSSGATLNGAIMYIEQLVPQSGVAAEGEIPDSCKPTADQYDFTTGQTLPEADPASLIHFGEDPVTWRSCLKRAQTVQVVDNLPTFYFQYRRSVNPLYKSTLFTSFSNLFDWIMPAYVCWKGSVRFRLDSRNLEDNVTWDARLGITHWRHGPYSGEVFANPINIDRRFVWSGSANQAGTQPRLVEVPWYNPYRFQFARSNTYDNDFSNDKYMREVEFWTTQRGVDGISIAASAGEDFTLVHFLSTPVITLI